MKTYILAAVMALMAGGAQAQTVTVDDNFITSTLRWDRSGSLTFALGVRETAAGNLVLCGAYATVGGSKFRDLNRQVLNRSRIIAGSDVLSRNMNFFKVANNSFARQEMIGAEAACVDTGKPINAVDFAQFEMDFYDGPYRTRN